MAKEETPSTSKDFEELQRKLSLLIESIQNNSKMVAFLKSPMGQYLDRHPFVALTLLVFIAVSAVPVGFFLLLVVLTSLAAFVGVILLEGLVIFVGGLSLLCVLCGLGFVSLAISGTIIVSYVVVSSLVNYWFSPRILSDGHPQLEGGLADGLLGFLSFCSINPGNDYQSAKLWCVTTTDAKPQWRLPAGYEAHSLSGALPGMTDPTEPELFPSHLWKAVGSYTPLGILGGWVVQHSLDVPPGFLTRHGILRQPRWTSRCSRVGSVGWPALTWTISREP
ncbi:Promethin [Pteropus alecto]|uniref:Promethin n=1 Tax=Pteropus alecto TaxID=9402 RepID=L5KNF3_PTEAL|nr:Promethin [Pteropus alecto]